MNVPEITVEEYAALRERGEDHVLIDVRESHEFELVNLGGKLIPLGELTARVEEIPREGRVIIHCRSGGRSARAVQYLMSQGYDNLENLAGGINEWSEKVDPGMPTY